VTDSVQPTVVYSVLEQDAERTARRLAEAPGACGLLEIRGDLLRGEEIVALVRATERPVIVTLRSREQGGEFSGDESQRRRILLESLAAGARFIDVELDSALGELADGEHADRVILSHHGEVCRPDELLARYRTMARTRAARLKIVPHAQSLGEIGAVRDLLEAAAQDSRALACFASGRAGALTRLLAPAWGSWATYGSAGPGAETAEGQFPAREMLEVHGVTGITERTRIFALVGSSVFGSPSPAMHGAGYRFLGLDARYVPLEMDDLDACLPLVGSSGLVKIDGLAVTMPFKETVWQRCVGRDEIAEASGAVNTVRVGSGGWRGFNTDGPAVLSLVQSRLEVRDARVAIVGAGGTARAAAAVLARAGARVTLYNRTLPKARAVADAIGGDARPLDELSQASWDVLVQATPLGRRGERLLPAERLVGGVVLDAVYGPRTPLVSDARARGLATIDGYELLVAQAVLQFEYLTDRHAPADVLREAGRAWLESREA